MREELILFFSGSLGGKMLPKIMDICEHRLLSCHGPYMGVARKWLGAACEHPKAKQREIMLDSGAFSAWSNGGEAHLDDVIASYDELVSRFVGNYRDIWLINLDKIPGEKGRSATQAEIAEAIKISDENFAILTERFGPRVLPVFHQDETPERLAVVLAQNPKYVCISPRNDLSEVVRREWSQRVHALCGSTWTHGLAATGSSMMRDVPWRSIDSAAWTQAAGYGIVRLCINGRMRATHISEDSSFRRQVDAHADHLPPVERDVIEACLAECEVTFEECRTSYDVRAYVNLYNYAKLAHELSLFKEAPVQNTLFAL